VAFVRLVRVVLYRVRGPRPLMAGVRQPKENNRNELSSAALSGYHRTILHSAVLYGAVIC
jgi:hypothetical protein